MNIRGWLVRIRLRQLRQLSNNRHELCQCFTAVAERILLRGAQLCAAPPIGEFFIG